ncbi:hypothetical protein F5Y08DRAFT_271449 [Xylaria arbuscula]|nr:hypothetical protein F5Y08DRAFT_271449 [Xylaria arbuscula]
MGIIMAAVIIGTALICAFAHCWRQIIEYGRRGKSARNKRRGTKRLRKEENIWAYPNVRGVSAPRFERLESELGSSSPFERVRWPRAYAQPGYCSVSPGLDKSSEKSESQTRPAAHWCDSSTTLPGCIGSDEVERPAGVACVSGRP